MTPVSFTSCFIFMTASCSDLFPPVCRPFVCVIKSLQKTIHTKLDAEIRIPGVDNQASHHIATASDHIFIFSLCEYFKPRLLSGTPRLASSSGIYLDFEYNQIVHSLVDKYIDSVMICNQSACRIQSSSSDQSQLVVQLTDFSHHNTQFSSHIPTNHNSWFRSRPEKLPQSSLHQKKCLAFYYKRGASLPSQQDPHSINHPSRESLIQRQLTPSLTCYPIIHPLPSSKSIITKSTFKLAVSISKRTSFPYQRTSNNTHDMADIEFGTCMNNSQLDMGVIGLISIKKKEENPGVVVLNPSMDTGVGGKFPPNVHHRSPPPPPKKKKKKKKKTSNQLALT
ncbi:putative signal peptide protein [Puccinia sorghi]|uniref:Putative signal peptide protein n=1 Tax=Puccinia sorghi TaxID=27349 RepID=A0A0L6UB55_9BASI|nr:putative signal peptide protein [Puccinia sorghi]